MKSKKVNAEISVEMGSSCTTGVHNKLLTMTNIMALNTVPIPCSTTKHILLICHPSFIPGGSWKKSLGYHH